MSDDLRLRADRIFQKALEVDVAERAALVERECADDAELRALVEELLSYVDGETEQIDPDGALRDALRSPDLLPTPEDAPREGETVGSFRLVRKIGAGGMGEVWEAEQSEPVKRRVALKLLRPGSRSETLLARFESERQALAMMQHPSIAQIIDAGASAGGRPYLVMELVAGLPVTDYCREKKLSLSDRLLLFMRVCAGVQHAHRRGVIHRDLKPSNVLVGDEGGEAIPKIIDFGLAKPTEGTLLEETMTLDGQVIGTPAYMSPEQTQPNLAGIDTRADVYALGAILYQLVAGVRPHEDLTDSSIDDVLRTIREVDPPLPSRAVDEAGGNARPVRGDLDWITMKALEKDRERRYESPANLAADLQRHLDGQPVEAGPPTAGYRVGKFVKRHALGVSAAAILVVLLATFSVTLGLQNRRVTLERDRANEEAEVAHAVSDFLVDLFQSPNPEEGAGKDVTALEILDVGAGRVSEELESQPEVQARIMHTMGRAFEGLGDFERSAEILEEAVEISTRVDGSSAAHVVLVSSLATAYNEQGRFPEAEELWRGALEMCRSFPERDAAVESSILNSLGMIRWRLGDVKEAEDFLDESIQLKESIDPRHPDLPRPLNNLAILVWSRSDFEGARVHLQKALSIWEEELGPEHPHVASTIANLALTYQDAGDNEASIPYHERALAIREKALGPDHPDVAETLNNLGNAVRDVGRPEEAMDMFRRALEIREESLGPDHVFTATTVHNIGHTYVGMGEWEVARPYSERALVGFEQSLGPEHPYVAYALLDLGRIQAATGNPTEARECFEKVLSIRLAALPPGHLELQLALERFAEFERAEGNPAAADSLLALAEPPEDSP